MSLRKDLSSTRKGTPPFTIKMMTVTLSNTDTPEQMRLVGHDINGTKWDTIVDLVEGPDVECNYFLSIRGGYFRVDKNCIRYRFTKAEKPFYEEIIH